MQPTVYWKNAIQQRLPFTFNPSVLYRGYAFSLANTASMIGSQFALADIFKKGYMRLLGKQSNSESVLPLFLGTFTGGFISGLWVGPIELAMIQQQRFGMGFGDCLRKIIRDFGFTRGIMRGAYFACEREGRAPRRA